MFFPCGFFFYLSSVSLWSPYGIGRPLYFRRVKKAKIPHSTKFSGDQLTIAGDVSIFQNGGRRHLGFSKFQNFDSQKGHGVKLRQATKFRGDRSNRY